MLRNIRLYRSTLPYIYIWADYFPNKTLDLMSNTCKRNVERMKQSRLAEDTISGEHCKAIKQAIPRLAVNHPH